MECSHGCAAHLVCLSLAPLGQYSLQRLCCCIAYNILKRPSLPLSVQIILVYYDHAISRCLQRSLWSPNVPISSIIQGNLFIHSAKVHSLAAIFGHTVPLLLHCSIKAET